MTQIKACTCQHHFQDIQYGKGKRVYNSCHESGKGVFSIKGWRCTVCGNVVKQ